MAKKSTSDNKGIMQPLINLLEVDDKEWMPYLAVQELLDFINPIDGQIVLDKRAAEVFIRPLPFYKETKLINIQYDDPEAPMNFYYLKQGDDLIVMNGQSDHIHEMNETGDLDINEDNVFDYVKFFSMFIDNEETQQPFYIIENENSEFIRHTSPYDQKRALRKFEGSKIESMFDGEQYKIDTRMMYNGYIYDVEFKVASTGEVVMENDIEIGST